MIRMKSLIGGLFLFLCLFYWPIVNSATITTEQWSRPRSGSMIVALINLNELVQRLDRFPNRQITIHYRSQDEGVLWAEELQSWLITLGVASNRIVLLPGLKKAGIVEVNISSGSTLR